jgi:hypothetical protein
MNILEVFESDKFYITEGLVFLKNSKRLAKLASKLEKKASIIPTDEEKKDAYAFIDMMKDVAGQYADVESVYSTGDKAEAKTMYNKMNIKYYELIKQINKESLKKFVIGAGAYMILTVLYSVFNAGRQNVSASASVSPSQDKVNALLRNLAVTKNEKEKSMLVSEITKTMAQSAK